MSKKQVIVKKFRPYLQALPDIFRYIIATKGILFAMSFVFSGAANFLLRSVGRVAVTSGDWKFLYTTWQGILILLLSLASLYICMAMDLNGKIALCGQLVRGEAVSIRKCLSRGFSSTRKLISLRGLLVILYISFVAPIIGLGFSISLTEGLYIPTFITAFIQESALYSSLMGIIIPILLILGIANLYTLHGIVFDDYSVKASSRQSFRLMRRNYKDYLKQNLLFFLTMAASIAIVAVVCLILPLTLMQMIPMPQVCSRFLVILFVSLGAVMYIFVDLFVLPLYLMKMTGLFFGYKNESLAADRAGEKEGRNNRTLQIICVAALLVAVIAQFICFDRWYPIDTDVEIIAHRAGGSEAPENTLAGLEEAYKDGASGCEIDIQRTKDGFYVLNHDNTFERTAGDKRKPEEMDLSEIKALRIDGEPVAEYEEILAAAKGRMLLLTELKGSTADRKMADDAVKLIHKYGMEDECVLISLKYDLIDYIETKYPDIETGFLTFASFGNSAGLNCDYIGLEAESATAYKVNTIHKEDKKVLVWTVNSKTTQRYYLCSEVDGIITDNIKQAAGVKASLASRSDFARMHDRVRIILDSMM